MKTIRILLFVLLGAFIDMIDGSQVKTICEHEKATIQCADGFSISITTARYGRKERNHCNQHEKEDSSVCWSNTAMGVVRNKCHNKKSCTLHASTTEFGDPCPGLTKYIQVFYQCLPDGLYQMCVEYSGINELKTKYEAMEARYELMEERYKTIERNYTHLKAQQEDQQGQQKETVKNIENLQGTLKEMAKENKKLEAQIVAVRSISIGNIRGEPVAFHALSTNDQSLGKGGRVNFPLVMYNKGNGFNANTGIFTCPDNGIYVFHASILSVANSDFPFRIMQENKKLVPGYTGSGGGFNSGSKMVVTKCNHGDHVWVGRDPYNWGGSGIRTGYNSFSGFKISDK